MATVGIPTCAVCILFAATNALTQTSVSLFTRVPPSRPPLNCSRLGTSPNSNPEASATPYLSNSRSPDSLTWFDTIPPDALATSNAQAFSTIPLSNVLPHQAAAPPDVSAPTHHIKRCSPQINPMPSVRRRLASAAPRSNTSHPQLLVPPDAQPAAPLDGPSHTLGACPLAASQWRMPNLRPSAPLVQPGNYCPRCVADYSAGLLEQPRRNSRRTDQLCSRHSPAPTVAMAPRASNYSAPPVLAPPAAPLDAPVRKHSASPQPSSNRPSPSTSRVPIPLASPGHFCQDCGTDYNNNLFSKSHRRSRRSDGLCSHHAPTSDLTLAFLALPR